VQLADKSPSLKRHICEAIAEHSNIASQSLRDQWHRLILQPLSMLDNNLPHPSLIILVDALDECEGENDIRGIIQLLAEARNLRSIRLRIFLTSRPEIPIRHGFHHISDVEYQDFVLHSISPSIIDNDISIFFKYNLEIIRREWAFDDDWPGEQTIRRLVQSAGGLFIWAATSCRFIGNGRRFAARRLSQILQHDTSIVAPEEKLNEIYLAVLTNSISGEYDEQEKIELYRLLKLILGTIVILFSPLPALSLARLLHTPKRDVDQTLDDLHSILEVPKRQDSPIRLHHPSFRDFLLEKQRCRDQHFWVDEKEAHGALARSCLRLMSANLKRDVCNLHAPGTLACEVDSNTVMQYLPAELQYACRYWVQHFQRSDSK
jgi:hypothetical protein